MSAHWISRLAQSLGRLFSWQVPYPPEPADRDADERRRRIELHAVRVRFADLA